MEVRASQESTDGVRLTLPYPPTTNHLMSVARGRKVSSVEWQRYQLQAANALQHQAYECIREGEIRVTFYVFMPRKADLDNRLKACQDVLTGRAWRDDIQIAEIRAVRHRAKGNPRVEVEIEAL